VRAVVFDIETYGSEEHLSFKDYRYLRDRSKAEREEEITENLSLNPFLSHVISVGYAVLEEEELKELKVLYLTERHVSPPQKTLTYMGQEYSVDFVPLYFSEFGREDFREGEKELISSLWKVLKDAELIVSYNGRRFDVPFLRIRSLTYDVPIPERVEKGEYHIDLMSFLFRGKGYEMPFYALDFVARHFGLKTPKEKADGKSVRQLFLQERYDLIAKYNAYDVIVILRLFQKFYRHIRPKRQVTEKQASFFVDLLKEVNGRKEELRELIRDRADGKELSLVIEFLNKLKRYLNG